MLAAYVVTISLGPLVVNDEIECGSPVRPAGTIAMTDRDASLCRSGLAELRVQAVACSAVAVLSLLGSVLLPRRY